MMVTGSRPVWAYRIFVGIGCLVLAGFLFLLVMVATGSVEGEEFSPDDFSRRRFSYVRPSWMPLTLVGVRFQSISSPLVTSLMAGGHLKPLSRTPQQWDLVRDNRQPIDSRVYDAAILCAYLDLKRSDGSSVLEAWTAAHPALAAVFWPAVEQLARGGRYAEISLLMDLVLHRSDLKLADLRQQIEALLGPLSLFP